MLALIEENGVVAVLSGHTHKFSENEFKGIKLVTGETTSKNMDKRPMGFRWWDVDKEGTMTHRFVGVEKEPEPAAKKP